MFGSLRSVVSHVILQGELGWLSEETNRFVSRQDRDFPVCHNIHRPAGSRVHLAPFNCGVVGGSLSWGVRRSRTTFHLFQPSRMGEHGAGTIRRNFI
jgi:hypothetical protein